MRSQTVHGTQLTVLIGLTAIQLFDRVATVNARTHENINLLAL